MCLNSVIFQADEMIREGDKNGDGKIQYEGKKSCLCLRHSRGHHFLLSASYVPCTIGRDVGIQGTYGC